MLDKYPNDIIEKARNIKVLVLDVDGVLTDGSLIYTSKGEETKVFNVNDGLGIFLLRKAGIKVVILTAKASKMVKKRAKDLKIDKVYQNFHNKLEAFHKIKRRFHAQSEEICFVGDDVIDVPVLKRTGLSICPQNAMDEVKTCAHMVLDKRGGGGAVREVCNLILKAQGKWIEVTEKYFNN